MTAHISHRSFGVVLPVTGDVEIIGRGNIVKGQEEREE